MGDLPFIWKLNIFTEWNVRFSASEAWKQKEGNEEVGINSNHGFCTFFSLWTLCNDSEMKIVVSTVLHEIYITTLQDRLQWTTIGRFNNFSVLALLPNFYFRKGDWVLGSVSTNFGIFPKFHNFLRSEVFSHWTTREHQLLHLVSGNNNNPVPLLFLWRETMLKVSKYFVTWCNSEVSWDTLLNSHDNAEVILEPLC